MLLDKDIDPETVAAQVTTDENNFFKQEKKSISSVASELVDFVYDQEDLKKIINDFAQKLQFNVLYPETEQITSKVTFDAGRKVTTLEAWDFVKMILEQAGYALIQRLPNIYTIVQTTKAHTEPLPIYIGVDWHMLPDSMERIRYVYYCSNISVSKQSKDIESLLNSQMLSTQPADKTALQFEPGSNSIILTTRADVIKSIMQLISVFDESGMQQTVEIVKLEHAIAADIVELFGKIITPDAKAEKGSGFVRTSSVARARYFSDNVKVLNLDPNNIRHLNSIVIIGKPDDIEEIKNFIRKYLDIAQEQGNSFYHVVELQWLQAADFVTVLQNLTAPSSGGGSGSGQSSGSIASDLSFDPYIQIVAEATRQGSNAGTTTAQSQSTGNAASTAIQGVANTVQRGANKLIVACSKRDWERIERLIAQVDVPQKQVVIETLVMDLDANFTKVLGAQMRTQGITTSIFPKYMQAQAGLIVNNVIGNPAPSAGSTANQDYYTLTGDLSDILNPDWVNNLPSNLTTPQLSGTIPPSTPTQTSSGSGPTSFSGNVLGLISGGKSKTGGAWAFFQLLSQHNSSKVFTRSVLLALNNQQVGVQNSLTKNLVANVTTGTNPTVNYVQDTAAIVLNVTPLISNNDTLNLQIDLDLTTYVNPDSQSDGTKAMRHLTTNVYLKSGDVLVLGGVMQELIQLSKTSVPFFERIPIIGNFFAARNKEADKKQLFIVIRATATTPRNHPGMNTITRNTADFMTDQLTEMEDEFAGLRDPITRWFFHTNYEGEPSEYFQDSLENLSKYDYGAQDIAKEAQDPILWHQKSEKQAGNQRIGWLTHAPSESPFGSAPADDDDMSKLSKLLKDMENPYGSRLQV